MRGGKRSKNLEDVEIETIINVLDGWIGKLTWDLLIDQVELRLFQRYTRQALHKHARVLQAYQLTQRRLKQTQNKPKRPRSVELQAAVEHIERLQAENIRLKAENDRLL